MTSHDDLKQLSALTAINEMLTGNHFSISTVDSVAAMLGVDPRCEARTILAPLHCIDYHKMPPELRDRIPDLVATCLGQGPRFKLHAIAAAPAPAPTAKPLRILRFLRSDN